MTGSRRTGPHGRRGLTKEEITLWLQVTRTVAPRRGAQPPEAPAEDIADPAPGPAPAATARHLQPPAKPAKGPYRPPALPLAPLERRLRQRLSRGQISVDMKIDLHGLRQDEAHAALREFLARARIQEAKLVLVVTGKGSGKLRDSAEHGFEGGVLRRSVPHWLSAPELRHIVLGFEEASASHGGAGALYVRLRGKRLTGTSHP